MSDNQFQLNEVFTRKIWKKLRENQVPIVSHQRYKQLGNVVETTNANLRSKAYMPSIGHGYLGLSKGKGVTRFLPILSDVDIAVYYHICFALSDVILKRRDRVFGGWHLVPKSQKFGAWSENHSDKINKLRENIANSYLQDYHSDPFSSELWLKEWRSFTGLIAELCRQSNVGNFVVQTDIANFYDSIEIPRVIVNLRKDAPDHQSYIEILEVFLSFWNRRINGYRASTKGIPQEIISDASRVISHYYLQGFDERFSEYCEQHGLVNVRWADDILIFGNSRNALELAVHKASRFLLADGLNLNASKTQFFSRSEFAKYRAINVLSSIGKSDTNGFRRNLRAAVRYHESNDMRMDTVFRAAIGFVKNLGDKAEVYEKNFVLETAKTNIDLLLTANARQMLALVQISDNKLDFFRMILRKVDKVPYAAPKSTFLQLLRKHHFELVKLGISKKEQLRSARLLLESSEDSEIIREWCAKPTIDIIGRL